MNYYTTINSTKGSLNIADYVFNQIAQETLEELSKNELKGAISLVGDKRRKNVETIIDKNKVTVNVYFSAMRNSDVQKSVNLIQTSVYESLNELTEISSIKVNVSVISFVDNK